MATKKELAAAREVQEEAVLSVTKKCRGKYLVDPEVEAERFEKWRGLVDAGDEVGARDMIEELAAAASEIAPFTVQARPADEGDWEGLQRAALPLIRLRGDTVGQGCGWDLNEEIVGHPFDGAEHTTECPNCGISISWKAPVFYE